VKVVKAGSVPENQCYEFGSFRLDPIERTLLRDGEPVALVPKSFDVLLVLVQKSGKLLDKDFLMRSVWPDATVEENSLARAIVDIRRALGEGPKDNRFIATIARRGYRFVSTVTSSRTPTESTIPLTFAGDPRSVVDGKATTLAVLPFAWLTPEGGDGSLAIGLADALITRLSNLTQIVVRPTSSILKYADIDRDPLSIASELKVDFVLSGSLQQANKQIRVTVQMVSPNEQRLVWADHFEEAFTHIFLVEDSISERVAAALALQLTATQRESLSRRDTENDQAYQLYLRGRYFWSRQTLASAEKPILCFRQALYLDPRYARAWAGIADAYVLIGLSGALTGGLSPHETYPEAKRAALAAIGLHNALAEAHASLGFIRFFYDWDPAEAQHELNRALSLHPRYANAYHGQALLCGFLERYEEALDWIQKALDIEPLSPILNANKGYLLYVDRRYNESVIQLKKTLEIDPAFTATHYRLGLAYGAQGRNDEAILHFQEAQRFSDDSPQPLGALGYVLGHTGDRQAAQEILQRLAEISKTRYLSPTIIAEVQTGLGQYEEAVRFLETAVHERSGGLFTFRVDPRFEQLRSDPRCQKVLQHLAARA
jgi:DNA-binding winged helix-turn-helix (wHTH) protein/tetratricopeptide (TPR) repeat protein